MNFIHLTIYWAAKRITSSDVSFAMQEETGQQAQFTIITDMITETE